MTTNVELAARLYRALREADAETLLSLLHRDFRGEVTEGLPGDFGGLYEGPLAMLGLWGRVVEVFAVRPRPEEFLAVQDGRVVVRGRYLGEAVRSGVPVDAVFAHILEFRDGRILALQQITDSQRWAQAFDGLDETEIVRRVMQAVADRDLDAIIAAYAADVEIREAASLPYGGVYRGQQGIIDHAYRYVSAWDRLQKPEDRDLETQCFGSGGYVAARWRQKATGADGSRLDLPVISLFELRNAKVVRLQMFLHDTAEVARFLEAQAS